MQKKNRQKMIQALTELVENWERWDCEVTVEQVRKISRSPRQSQLVAETVKDPHGLFAEQLKKMALCMKTMADGGIGLGDLIVCLLEGGEKLRLALVEKIRQLDTWNSMS